MAESIVTLINSVRDEGGYGVSGRISMRNPNLQQIPARDPVYGPMIRSLFLPEEGDKWAAIDFSQQEPRILVHMRMYTVKREGYPWKARQTLSKPTTISRKQTSIA
jgi:hypothetical protein